MASLEEITDRVREGLRGGEGLAKSLKVDFKGDGFLHVEGRTVVNEDKPADCVVAISRDDLVALAAGRLDPMSAMMRGKLKITGDMGVAMQLRHLLKA